MTSPKIKGATGIEGGKLIYDSSYENNKRINSFTDNDPVFCTISLELKSLFRIDKDTGELIFKHTPDYESTQDINELTLEFITNYNSSTLADNFFVELYDSYNHINQSTPINF